jgi:hypothetical protein
MPTNAPWAFSRPGDNNSVRIELATEDRKTLSTSITPDSVGDGSSSSPFPAQGPNTFVVPILAGRKVPKYDPTVTAAMASLIGADMSNLSAILTQATNQSFPPQKEFSALIQDVFGFAVTPILADSGVLPGTYVTESDALALTQFGDGVPHVVFMIALFARSRGKVFLIEEPENDLHPKILRKLLDFIVLRSAHNQFVITTHSNIVTRHLCAESGSKLFHVSKIDDDPFAEAKIEAVSNEPSARLAVMSELGYTLADQDLPVAWIVLEESSAEQIIRTYFVSWYAPGLVNSRTVSARGVTKVGRLFEELKRIVLFAHLQQPYRDLAWVLVDGDAAGTEVINKLVKDYKDWPPSRFKCFSKPQFEDYYPPRFHPMVQEIRDTRDKDAQREKKEALLKEVFAWIERDPQCARQEFEKSAADVIEILREIQGEIAGVLP